MVRFIHEQNDILSIVERNIISQEKAIIRFRPFIKNISISAFNKASYEYTNQYERNYANSMPVSGVHTDELHRESSEEGRRKIILSRINKSLEYAPIK